MLVGKSVCFLFQKTIILTKRKLHTFLWCKSMIDRYIGVFFIKIRVK